MRVIAGMILFMALTATVRGSEYPTLPIGASAPDFTLAGVDGKAHRLSDYATANVLAVTFMCNSCPVAELAEGKVEKLYRDYRDRGVALVAINPNNPGALRLEEQSYSDVGETLDDMKSRMEFRRLNYPYLYDGDTQQVAARFGPTAIPSVFVFDRARKLQYSGSVDEAAGAIDALLAGRNVAIATIAPAGCPPAWKSHATDTAAELKLIEAEPVSLTPAAAADLKKLRSNPTGKLLLVNFWATWCSPCVSEFPDLQAIYRTYRGRGLDVVTVAENEPAERAGVLKLLQKEHASSTNLLFASTDTAAMQEAFDHNMGAAVPFTVLIDANGEVVYQEEGEITLLSLRRAILQNLEDSKEFPGLRAYWSAQ